MAALPCRLASDGSSIPHILTHRPKINPKIIFARGQVLKNPPIPLPRGRCTVTQRQDPLTREITLQAHVLFHVPHGRCKYWCAERFGSGIVNQMIRDKNAERVWILGHKVYRLEHLEQDGRLVGLKRSVPIYAALWRCKGLSLLTTWISNVHSVGHELSGSFGRQSDIQLGHKSPHLLTTSSIDRAAGYCRWNLHVPFPSALLSAVHNLSSKSSVKLTDIDRIHS